jgi:hypothetical protein
MLPPALPKVDFPFSFRVAQWASDSARARVPGVAARGTEAPGPEGLCDTPSGVRGAFVRIGANGGFPVRRHAAPLGVIASRITLR